MQHAEPSFDEPTVADSSEVPLQDLTEISPLSEEEFQLLAKWNDTQTPYSKDKCIHQLFEMQVQQTPDVIAVVQEDVKITYGELNQRANQLAHYVRRLGVGSDTLVGIYIDRSLDMLISILGVLKAGGAYVPLDPAYPWERLTFLIQDAQPTLILTVERLQTRIPQSDTCILCIDLLEETLAAEAVENVESAVGPDNIVYVIYTSGSTGIPKGILIRHQSLVNYAQYALKRYGLQREERVLQFASINFDASAEEIFPCLISGATLVLRTDAMLNSIATFLHACETWQISVLDLPTAYWHELTLRIAEEALALPASVRVVIIGGERVLPERLAMWQQHVSNNVQLFNTYGPTETTIVVTVAELHSLNLDTSKKRDLSIGCPVANTQIYLLNANMRLVPIGEPGEIYIGGVGLARGYHRRPELTAERFIPHPFSNDKQARLYKSGDIGRYLPNGEIEFLCRVDQQVKIRGFRIEPEEVEAHIRQYPGVRDAIVLAREDTPGDKQLVAYMATRPESGCNPRELRQFLEQRLPDYMVPSAFVVLEHFPMTPNGKIDKRSLPAPARSRDNLGTDFVAPTHLMHQQLIAIWEELLPIRPIGIRDNFFYLGGHSLLAARMVARIEQIYGKKLELRTLFVGPTIEDIAQALQKEQEVQPHTPIVAVQARGGKRSFFYLHGAWDSEAFYCFQLARHLTTDQPFYALSPYHCGSGEAIPTLEEMALIHLESIRTIQPEGPYLLGGFCNGGLVAYEMARQLLARGERVECLVLIDPAYPPTLHVLARGVVNLVGHLFGLAREKQIEYFLRLRHIFKYMMRQRKSVADLKAFRDVDLSLLTLTPTTHALLLDQHGLFDWMIADYNYEPYADRIIMIWAQKEPFRAVWRRKAVRENAIEVQFVPGTHVSCRTEHIQDLAEALGRSLNGPQATGLKGRSSSVFHSN